MQIMARPKTQASLGLQAFVGSKIKLTGPAATGVREEEGPYRRVRLNAWLGHSRRQLECDLIAHSISAAILRRPLEPLD
jgi:hypothetical protein